MLRIYPLAVIGALLAAAVRAEGIADAIDAQESSDFAQLLDTEDERSRRVRPSEVLSGMELPREFSATRFAAEPAIQLPIAVTIDANGRLWIAENYTYSEAETGCDESLRDHILILEDVDGDGVADGRKVVCGRDQPMVTVQTQTEAIRVPQDEIEEMPIPTFR